MTIKLDFKPYPKYKPIYEKCGRYRAERRAYSSPKMCLEVLDNYIEVEQ